MYLIDLLKGLATYLDGRSGFINKNYRGPDYEKRILADYVILKNRILKKLSGKTSMKW